ncbi:MAG: hemolysin family protein [Parachlamydiaceae bacterium]
MELAFFWLLFNFSTIVLLAFFSMEEMACVSFNKVRLQFLVKQGSKRAQWLSYLLHNPSRLFGTTLIAVNVATIVGSECSRQFHQALNLSPEWAPLSQIMLVIIFGELAPMFAARKYPEHVALLGVPILYVTSKILAPLIWILGIISKAANFLIGGEEPHPELFLTQDELQKVIEEQDEDRLSRENEELNVITTNIFRFKDKTAKHVMTSLESQPLISSTLTVEQLRKSTKNPLPYFLVFNKNTANIIGIAFVRELVKVPGNRKVKDFCKPLWYLTENTPLFQIIKQFRRNSEHVAVVLDASGRAKGVLNFEDVVEEIFGKVVPVTKETPPLTYIDRTLPGKMTLTDFREEFGVPLDGDPEDTLSDFLIAQLEQYPEGGETVQITPFEFTVKEVTFLGIKTVSLKSLRG